MILNTLPELGNAKPVPQKAEQKLHLNTAYFMKIWLFDSFFDTEFSINYRNIPTYSGGCLNY